MPKNRPETRTNAARTQKAVWKRPRATNNANIAPTHRQIPSAAGRAGLPLKHVIKASMLYLKHIGLTRLGTDSGAADFLRSARPAEAAIAKVFAQVFAKIRQKILFCKFFGRTGTSRTTRRQNFSLERPLAVPKTSKKRKKKSEFFTISELSFSSFLIDFGGARLFLTSKSSSSRFFALDCQIFRSVRRLGLIFDFS